MHIEVQRKSLTGFTENQPINRVFNYLLILPNIIAVSTISK